MRPLLYALCLISPLTLADSWDADFNNWQTPGAVAPAPDLEPMEHIGEVDTATTLQLISDDEIRVHELPSSTGEDTLEIEDYRMYE